MWTKVHGSAFINGEVGSLREQALAQIHTIYRSLRDASSHDPRADVNCLKFLCIFGFLPWPDAWMWSLPCAGFRSFAHCYKHNISHSLCNYVEVIALCERTCMQECRASITAVVWSGPDNRAPFRGIGLGALAT